MNTYPPKYSPQVRRIGAEPLRAEVAVSLGPGHHGSELVRALENAGLVLRSIHSWPELECRDFCPQTRTSIGRRRIRWYRGLVHAMWGLWRRLPRVGKGNYPRIWADRIFDLLASRMLGNPGVFIGWSQLSLRSLRKASQGGAITILEHPMLHVDAWRDMLTTECRSLGIRPYECFSHISQAMQQRMKLEYAAADYILVPSAAAVSSFVSAGVPRQKLLCAPFGVDMHLFSPKTVATRSNSKFRVLFAGRLEVLKGLPYILQAWKMAGLPDAELLLVGTVLRETAPILRRFPAPGVRVIEAVPQNDLPEIYRSCDVLVFPSLCDGFGLVLLEAMACGLPVIATENSGGPDCVVDGNTGFITRIRDAESIARHLQWIYSHREAAAEMGRRGRILVESRFRWEDYAARLRSCFRQVVEPGVPDGPGCAL